MLLFSSDSFILFLGSTINLKSYVPGAIKERVMAISADSPGLIVPSYKYGPYELLPISTLYSRLETALFPVLLTLA